MKLFQKTPFELTIQGNDPYDEITIKQTEEGLQVEGPISNSCWEAGEAEGSTQTIGTLCKAKGVNSVAEGENTLVLPNSSSVEGWNEGKGAHAEGAATLASGNFSHAEGNSTVTNNPYEHAEGLFNYSNYTTPVYPHGGNTIHSVGVGTNLENRKNAFEIMQNGDVYIIGIGGYDGTNATDTSVKSLQEVLTSLS